MTVEEKMTREMTDLFEIRNFSLKVLSLKSYELIFQKKIIDIIICGQSVSPQLI